MIAEHLEAGGDLHAAYHWHMRTATWATNRDITAAHMSWRRAREVADQLPDDDPDRMWMRIAPRTLLCGLAFRGHCQVEQSDQDLRRCVLVNPQVICDA